MLANNNQRFSIWQTLANPFDYNEFSTACAREGAEPLTAYEFAQKAGLLTCAATLYPQLSARDAYLKLIDEHQQDVVAKREAERFSSMRAQSVVLAPTTNCKSCGGGKVR